MGFFDSIKKVVNAVAKEVSGEAGEERNQAEAQKAEKRKQYLDALAPYYYAFDNGAGISVELEKKILTSLGFADVDETLLNSLRSHSYQEGKDRTEYIFRRKVPENKIAPYDLLELLCPGICQKMLDGLAEAIDLGCKYDDYTIDGQIKKLSSPLESFRVKEATKAILEERILEEFENRIRQKNTTFCKKAMEEYGSAFVNYYVVNKKLGQERKLEEIFGMVLRIDNFARYYLNGKEHVLITEEQWNDNVDGIFRSSLENLSPEGQAAKRKSYRRLLSEPLIEYYWSLPVYSEYLYDAWLYLSYTHYYEEVDLENIVTLVDNVKNVLDQFENSGN